MTGLSRPAVNKGIKELGPLLKVTPGIKNSPTIEGVAAYEINLDISTEELVNRLYWLKNFTSKKSALELVKKVNSTKENTKEILRTTQNGTQAPPTPGWLSGKKRGRPRAQVGPTGFQRNNGAFLRSVSSQGGGETGH